MKPYFENDYTTIYNSDFRECEFKYDPLFIFDPPYNINFKYDIYSDSMPEDEYIEMLGWFQGWRAVVIHYPEETFRLVSAALGYPDSVSAWCYNQNTPRRLRLITYYNCTPDYSRIKQPYKNPTDKRVAQLIANGNGGSNLYE